MGASRLPMRQIREILRLKYEGGLGHRAIARSCGVGLGTVSEYVGRARRAGLVLAAARRSWTTPRWRRGCSSRLRRGVRGRRPIWSGSTRS